MKFLVCPDSFKDSMSSIVASEEIAKAIKSILPTTNVSNIPLSDGGQGFFTAIQLSLATTSVTTLVTGPIIEKIEAKYLLLDDNQTAVIEMANIAGLELLPIEKRNPLFTTTYGVGELILHILNHYPVKKIIIGLGGSATNDGGAGMLQALGAKLTDSNNNEIPTGGQYLRDIRQVDLNSIDSRILGVEIEIACDVTNPLLGENGATYTYASQKGANYETIIELESGLTNYSQRVLQSVSYDYSSYSGAGAAGGLAYGLLLLGGKLVPGFDLIAKYANLENQIQFVDYVISGEGSVDEQTINGKTISRIATLCKKHNKPLLVFCGRSQGNLEILYQHGVTAIFPITNGATSLTNALSNARENLYNCVSNVIRLLAANNKK